MRPTTSRVLGTVVFSGTLVGLSLALPSPDAHARPVSTTFYVATFPRGNDHVSAGRGANTCTSPSQPCATIAQAIDEEGVRAARGGGGAVISLARGVYDDPDDAMFRDLGPSNDNVTITGAGQATEIEPTGCSDLRQVTNGPDAAPTAPVSESAIVNIDGLHGVTIENMTLDGSGLRRAGCDRTAGYHAAILVTRAATDNTVTDVDISGDTTYGIQMDGDSQTTVDGDRVAPKLCTATITTPADGLGAGWKYDQTLKVSRIPKCAHDFSGVIIDGISYAATTSTDSKNVVLTGGPVPPATPSIARRSTIVFDTSVASYTAAGIACNTLIEPLPSATSCSISATTVVGGGTVYTGANSPVGILVTDGATADLQGNKVGGNADATGNGIGIGLLPDTVDGVTAAETVVGTDVAAPGTGETLNGNDISILGTAFPSVASSAQWTVSGNTVGANHAGILLSGLTAGTNMGSVMVSDNTVAGTVSGAGVELADDAGAGGAITIGAPTRSLSNTISGNGIGITLTEGTTGVVVENNSVTDNVDFGVAVDGADAMPEFLPGLAANDNTFSDNTWTGNGSPTPGVINGGANIVDFGAFAFPLASQSIGGSAAAQATDLTLAASIPGGTTPSSISLVKASGVVEIGPGTLVSIAGYCAASTFGCNGTNVSFFVTSVGTPSDPTGVIGTTPVLVNVAPIAPSVAAPLALVAAGAAVTTNRQVPLATSNIYSGNSCTPTAPNTSTTMAAGTGGGPAGPEGSQTGYDAC